MDKELEASLWPEGQLEEALTSLAKSTGWRFADAAGSPFSRPELAVEQRLENWAQSLQLEVEAVHARYGEVETLLATCAPAVLRLADKSGTGWYLVARSSKRRLTLLGRDLRLRRVSLQVVASAMRRASEAPASTEVEALLDRIGLSSRRRARAREALHRERLSGALIGGCWHLRQPPGESFFAQLKAAGLGWQALVFVGSYLLQYAMFLLSWLLLGRGALQGVLSGTWLMAWAFLLLTLVPLRLISAWSRARLAVGIGALLKKRLLQGALNLEPEEVRHLGVGQLLGKVVESEAVESMAMNGGFLAVAGVLDLVLAAGVVAAGASGGSHVVVLVVWFLMTGILARRYWRLFQRWTESRLRMTHDFVERLLGHRTRLAQESHRRWHVEEDRLLNAYFGESQAVDSAKAWLMALIPRGWLVASSCVLTPSFVWGGDTKVALAVGIGGMLAAYGGFGKISEGFMHLARAGTSWRQAEDLFGAAARSQGTANLPWPSSPLDLDEKPTGELSEPAEPIELVKPSNRAEPSELLLEAQDLMFRYPGRERTILDRVSFRIEAGDRWLLEGASGGGKSTLAAVLSGLRRPDSGILLLRGMDLSTLGCRSWRQRIASVPQFHENHVLSETFAFNLLMGRSWPPTKEDMAEAEEVCRELGLGELLGRMPAGLMQMVGETGWQLSHGERSRLFIARSLLQRAEVVVLDESLAALDPGNFHLALEAVNRRASAVLLIAHP